MGVYFLVRVRILLRTCSLCAYSEFTLKTTERVSHRLCLIFMLKERLNERDIKKAVLMALDSVLRVYVLPTPESPNDPLNKSGK